MSSMLNLRADRFQPDPEFTFGLNRDYRNNQRILASLVGAVAIGMPLVMIIWGHADGCYRQSISHHYYTRFLGTVFVGSLVFIGAFLISYRGETRRENLYATIAGLGATLVAMFPTDGTGCPPGQIQARLFAAVQSPDPTAPTPPEWGAYFELFAGASTVHYTSAAAVFTFLAWYCLVVFTRPEPGVSADPATGALNAAKRTRNTLYVACGCVILICIIAMALEFIFRFSWWNGVRATFWAETLALWAFGVSWIVKGRLFGYAFND